MECKSIDAKHQAIALSHEKPNAKYAHGRRSATPAAGRKRSGNGQIVCGSMYSCCFAMWNRWGGRVNKA